MNCNQQRQQSNNQATDNTMSTELLNNLFLVGGFATAVIAGMFIIPNILFISHKKKLFDLPDERKVHKTPIPRLGGLSFFPVILISVFLSIGLKYMLCGQSDPEAECQELVTLLLIFAGMTMLYLVGESDDLVGVGYKVKFLIQILASALMILSGNWIHSLAGLFGIYEIPAWIGIPLTLVAIVYITNAINLIDGIDGLASGLCCISLAVLSGLLIRAGIYIEALLALATLGVLIPFWFYNVFGNERKGNKLFMGDAGSLSLGYILSFILIILSKEATYPAGTKVMIIAFSTLIIPLLDVVRVVLHRVRKRRNPFLPDKNHFHHKLLRTGMRARSVLITIIATSIFFITLNALLSPAVNITVLLLIDITLWILLHLAINRKIREYSKLHPEMARSYVGKEETKE